MSPSTTSSLSSRQPLGNVKLNRRHRPLSTADGTSSPALALTVIVATFVGVVAFTAGIVIGQRSLYQVQAEAEIQAVRDWMDGLPEYSDLTLRETPDGHVSISGFVPDEQAVEKLQGRLDELFGSERAAKMLGSVVVEPHPED